MQKKKHDSWALLKTEFSVSANELFICSFVVPKDVMKD